MLNALDAEQDRRTKNAARQPVVKDVIEQDQIVRQRIPRSQPWKPPRCCFRAAIRGCRVRVPADDRARRRNWPPSCPAAPALPGGAGFRPPPARLGCVQGQGRLAGERELRGLFALQSLHQTERGVRPVRRGGRIRCRTSRASSRSPEPIPRWRCTKFATSSSCISAASPMPT